MKARFKSKVSCGGGTRRKSQEGLTMTEVCCALAALALLMMVALPALATSKARSQRLLCANNLSRIGIANAIWGADNNNLRPMMVPYWEGGSGPFYAASEPLRIRTTEPGYRTMSMRCTK